MKLTQLIGAPWLAIALLTGSQSTLSEEPESITEDASTISWRDRYMALGHDVFEAACAQCHANAEAEAPQIGEREDWVDRSPLWSAVLLAHAREGYMEMQAKGDQPYLSDRAVEAAGEYMLGETFPELPVD